MSITPKVKRYTVVPTNKDLFILLDESNLIRQVIW